VERDPRSGCVTAVLLLLGRWARNDDGPCALQLVIVGIGIGFDDHVFSGGQCRTPWPHRHRLGHGAHPVRPHMGRRLGVTIMVATSPWTAVAASACGPAGSALPRLLRPAVGPREPLFNPAFPGGGRVFSGSGLGDRRHLVKEQPLPPLARQYSALAAARPRRRRRPVRLRALTETHGRSKVGALRRALGRQRASQSAPTKLLAGLPGSAAHAYRAPRRASRDRASYVLESKRDPVWSGRSALHPGSDIADHAYRNGDGVTDIEHCFP